MSRQYMVPGKGGINETSTRQYIVPGWGEINETQGVVAGGKIIPYPWMETSGGMQDMTGGFRN